MEKDKKKSKGLALGAVFQTINTDIESKSIPYQPNTVSLIPTQNIEVNPFQPRNEFNPELLQELAQSVLLHGLIQPITVRHLGGDNFQLIAGERRLRACKLAKIEHIPAFIRTANDEQMIEMALIENIQRQDLNAIEIAITYKRIMEEFDLTQELTAQRVGKTRETVTNYLRLLKLPEEIQLGIKNEKISMGHARAIIGLSDYALQMSVYKETLEKHLSVRAVEALVQKLKEIQAPQSDKKSKTNPNPTVEAVQKQIAELLGSRVQLRQNPKGQGKIVIHFADGEDLNRILELLDKN